MKKIIKQYWILICLFIIFASTVIYSSFYFNKLISDYFTNTLYSKYLFTGKSIIRIDGDFIACDGKLYEIGENTLVCLKEIK